MSIQTDSSNGTAGPADRPELDVVIVGGGPVGLLLAGDLAAAGVRPVVLESTERPSEIPKANGVVGRAAVELRARGLLRGTGLRVIRTPRFRFGPLTLQLGLLRSPLHILPVPQRQLTELLEQRAARLGATIRRGHEFTEFTHDDSGTRVIVRAKTPDIEVELSARYLVGCDGAHSPVRKQAGIGFPGITSTSISRQGRVIIPATVATRDRNQLTIPGIGSLEMFGPHLTAAGSFTIAPADVLDRTAPADLYIVNAREPRGGAQSSGAQSPGAQSSGAQSPGAQSSGAQSSGDLPKDDLPEDELRASLRRVLGAEVPFTTSFARRRVVGNSRQAERYRSGRVFLAGDAAHIFSAGGSALNVGLIDAISLGEKLTAVLRGGAGDGLLDSYQAQRYPAGQRTLAQTRLQSALEEADETGQALREVFGELVRDQATARRVAALMEC